MENAHGDLYVYANQKRHATSDGSVSALLHLEMQNLGDLDVYVKLLQNNVSTHFYVEDESIIDFLEEHMDLLTERLEGKGYSVANKVSSREQLGAEEGTKSEDVINRIREREGTSDQVLVSMNAFDVGLEAMAEDKNKVKTAVALEYDPEDEAPKVVASGRGILAEKIIEKAKEADVPVHADDKLADTLSRLEIGEMIPPELYGVVAEVLVFVDAMDKIKAKMAKTPKKK